MKTLITITAICAAFAVSGFAADDAAGKGKGKGKGGGKGRPDPAQIFSKLDADKSGGISLEEYKANPRSKQMEAAKVEERFKKMAGDDGIVSEKEFTAAMKKMAEMRGGKSGPPAGGKGKGAKKGATTS